MRGIGTFAAVAALIGVVGVGAGSQPAEAIATSVPLGAAEPFAVLGGESVTNTGPSVITGDLGVSPGSSITGFPPGVVNGTIHATDAVALQAQTDLVAAYDDAASQATDASAPSDLSGLTLVPGVYTASSSLLLTGTVTLDAGGDPNAVWVFQIGSSLTTATGSTVALINGAQACNVFWQVGSSATLGTASVFVGNVLALTSISATTGATVDGRLLARNGSVTLDSNIITSSTCQAEPGPTTTSTVVATTAPATTAPATTAPPTAAPTAAPTTAPVDTAPTTTLSPTTAFNPVDITLPPTGQREATGSAVVAAILLAVGVGTVAIARRRSVSR